MMWTPSQRRELARISSGQRSEARDDLGVCPWYLRSRVLNWWLVLTAGLFMVIWFAAGCKSRPKVEAANPLTSTPALKLDEGRSSLLDAAIVTYRREAAENADKAEAALQRAIAAEKEIEEARKQREIDRANAQAEIDIAKAEAQAEIERAKAREEASMKTLNRFGAASLIALLATIPAYFLGGWKAVVKVLLIAGAIAAFPYVLTLMFDDLRPIIAPIGAVGASCYLIYWLFRLWLDVRGRYLAAKGEVRAGVAMRAQARGRTSEKDDDRIWRKQQLAIATSS